MDSLLPENHGFWRIDAAPLQPLLEHHHSYKSRDETRLDQLSALWHPALGHFSDDASGYVTSKSLNDIDDFMFQYVVLLCIFELEHAKKISILYLVNLIKSSWSSGMVER